MKKYRFVTAVALTVAFAAALSLVGCGGGTDTKKPDGPSPTPKPETKTEPKGGGSTVGAAGGATAFKSEAKGTVKGMVKFEGDAGKPEPLDFSKASNKTDIPVCEAGKDDEKTQPLWRVGPNKGVGNVVVWVRAPKGQYFDLTDAQKKAARAEVKIDQPHCAFLPHVDVLYPSYFDGKKQVATGQKFSVINTASITHNTNYDPATKLLNGGENALLPSKATKDIELKPSKPAQSGGEEYCELACQIHPWMKGYVWVLDHPFSAVTHDDGGFELKDVPTGELTLVYWHESFGKTPKTKSITVKAGDNTESLTVGK